MAKKPPDKPTSPQGEVVLYQTEDGAARLDVRVVDGNAWLSLNQLATLFQRDKSVISRHLKNIFEEGELNPKAAVACYATTAADGKTYQVDHYSLDVIIAVGYRVRSLRGTQFRIWATGRLREYIVKGFTLDDARLKQAGGGGYFDELLERIRDIRSSERVFWRKVLDIYATSVDYDPRAEMSEKFFATIQNKMHWAIHGRTAAEIVHERADAAKPNMGLTSWPGSKIRRADVTVAKNYLTPEELEGLNRIVSAYLEFAELQALRRRPMHMADWIAKLDEFLRISDREILTHAGKISHEVATAKAEAEFEEFRARRLAEPTRVDKDFEDAAKRIEGLKPPRQRKPKQGDTK